MDTMDINVEVSEKIFIKKKYLLLLWKSSRSTRILKVTTYTKKYGPLKLLKVLMPKYNQTTQYTNTLLVYENLENLWNI